MDNAKQTRTYHIHPKKLTKGQLSAKKILTVVFVINLLLIILFLRIWFLLVLFLFIIVPSLCYLYSKEKQAIIDIIEKVGVRIRIIKSRDRTETHLIRFSDIEYCIIYEHIGFMNVSYVLGIKLKVEGHYFKPLCVS